ncbi:MAG: hypothetical protein K8S99_14820 [Planctomycetes bacterium]|nr:hypothetical protein [Planctomycetota bacterium]
MAETRNPFEHHHHHGHDHDHDHGAPLEEEFDPAQQSLNDALRVSFWVLKVAMLIVVVFYLCSNIFSVPSTEVAVRLRFGQIVGEPGKQVINPGGPHFALPFPIEQVVRIPTSVQQFDLATEFWFNLTPDQVGLTLDQLATAGASTPKALNPERDGSLITGDANIVHARWSLSYKVIDPVAYLKNVGDEKAALAVVHSAAEAGILRSVARLTADEVVKGQIDREEAIRNIQQTLDALETGVRVEQLSIAQPTPPMAVRDAFQAVTRAESNKARDIEKALQDRATILGAAAGEAHKPLLGMIRAYEKDLVAGDQAAIAKREAQIDEAFGTLNTGAEFGTVPISGAAAQVINEALSYRSSIGAQIEADASRFRNYYDTFKNDPARRRIVINRLWQEARRDLLTGDVETMYVPPGHAWIKLNRDPNVTHERQMDDLKARGLSTSGTGLKRGESPAPRGNP